MNANAIGKFSFTASRTSWLYAAKPATLTSEPSPNCSFFAYMEDLWETLGKELTNSHRLQKVVKWKKLMNWFVGKASRKEEMGDMLTGMIADKEAQKALWSPWFLFKTILLP